MYTQKRHFAFPITLAVVLLPSLSASVSATASETVGGRPVETTADRRIDIGHARVADPSRRTSAATQHTANGLREESQPRRSVVAMAAYDEVLPEPLPELVDQGVFPMEVNCGAEYGLPGEVGCGIEGCISCMGEVGCGAETGSISGIGCGVEGCVSCVGDASCGVEAGYGPGCGVETLHHPGFASECIPLCLPIFRINWCRFEFFGGVQSFSGPANYAGEGTDAADRDGSSSFGIHEGFNEARPLALFGGTVSGQFGLRATQSNFSGAEFTDRERRQIFMTSGLFRRVDYGLQGGLVLDHMYDDWYFDVHLTQIRGELSWLDGRCNEFGYGFMAGIYEDDSNTTIRIADGSSVAVNVALEAVDQHRFFYRRHFREGGHAEAFAGFTGDDDGLLGAMLELPLRSSTSLRTGVTYLIPESAQGQRDNQEESWNLGVSLVWYPCGRCGWSRYNRPLMNVADNGTFLVDRQ